MSEVDYSGYTLKDLYEARTNVNREAYPRNAEMIDYWIAIKEEKLPADTPPPKKKEPVKPVHIPETPRYTTETIEPREPLPPPGDLPFLKVISDTIDTSWNMKFDLLRALLLPYLIVFLLEFAHHYVALQFGVIASLGTALVKSIVYAMFAVSCHRTVLLGSDSIPKFGVLIPGVREFRFWGMTVVMAIIIIVLSIVATFPMSLIALDPMIFIAIVFIPGLYLMGRLAILFPAIAVDKTPTMAWSWALTRENGLRMSALLMIPALPVYAYHHLLGESESLIVSSAGVLLSFVLAVIGIILISLSYRELTKGLEPMHGEIE